MASAIRFGVVRQTRTSLWCRARLGLMQSEAAVVHWERRFCFPGNCVCCTGVFRR